MKNENGGSFLCARFVFVFIPFCFFRLTLGEYAASEQQRAKRDEKTQLNGNKSKSHIRSLSLAAQTNVLDNGKVHKSVVEKFFKSRISSTINLRSAPFEEPIRVGMELRQYWNGISFM